VGPEGGGVGSGVDDDSGTRLTGLERFSVVVGSGREMDGEERESGRVEFVIVLMVVVVLVDPPAKDFSTAILAEEACSSLRQ